MINKILNTNNINNARVNDINNKFKDRLEKLSTKEIELMANDSLNNFILGKLRELRKELKEIEKENNE